MSSPLITNLEFATTASLFDKYQINFGIDSVSSLLNQFDPDEISITATFNGPGGKVINVNAFWATDFCRNNTPDPTYQPCLVSGGPDPLNIPDPDYLTPYSTLTPWHVRFAPPITGIWSYYFVIIIGSSSTTTLPGGTFDVLNSSNKGFIAVKGRNFVFGNSNDIFFSIGINAVLDQGTPTYYNRSNYVFTTYAIEQIAINKGNYSRIFLSQRFFDIEWSDGGLTKK